MYSIINLENDPQGIINVRRNPRGLYLVEFIEGLNRNKVVITLDENQYVSLSRKLRLQAGVKYPTRMERMASAL